MSNFTVEKSAIIIYPFTLQVMGITMSHSINTILITKIETVSSLKEKSVKSDLQKL